MEYRDFNDTLVISLDLHQKDLSSYNAYKKSEENETILSDFIENLLKTC